MAVDGRHPHRQSRRRHLPGDWLYFETPDCHLVSLNVKDGTERWRQKICDLDLFYYGSVAPVIVKNMVIAGVSGDDLDFPGYVQAHDHRHRRAAVEVVGRAAEDGRAGLGDRGRTKTR